MTRHWEPAFTNDAILSRTIHLFEDCQGNLGNVAWKFPNPCRVAQLKIILEQSTRALLLQASMPMTPASLQRQRRLQIVLVNALYLESHGHWHNVNSKDDILVVDLQGRLSKNHKIIDQP